MTTACLTPAIDTMPRFADVAGNDELYVWNTSRAFGAMLDAWLSFARSPANLNRTPATYFDRRPNQTWVDRKLRLLMGQALMMTSRHHAGDRLPVWAGLVAVRWADREYTRTNTLDVAGEVDRAVRRGQPFRTHATYPFLRLAQLALRDPQREAYQTADIPDAAWQFDQLLGGFITTLPDSKWETHRPYVRLPADILRDILPPPVAWPGPLPGRFATADVAAMARRANASGDFGVLPVLADALEEAGFAGEDTLQHLRGFERCQCRLGVSHGNEELCGGSGWVKQRRHFRGCWALDRILEAIR